MSDCNDCPSFSVTGTLDYCTNSGSNKFPLSLNISEVTENSCSSPTIQSGASVVVAPGTTPASFFYLRTPQQVRIQLNGGAEDIVVDRLFMWTGPVNSVEIFNDQVAPAKDVQVDVQFITGKIL